MKLASLSSRSERTGEPKSLLDTDNFTTMLQNQFGEDFEAVCLKINSVLTDSCTNAKTTREKVRNKLEELVSRSKPRQALPCTAHIAKSRRFRQVFIGVGKIGIIV